MGDAAKTNMGACEVEFGGQNLGYTKGFVSLDYATETMEKTVDQEDSAIDELITKQSFIAKVPLAERNLAIFGDLFPGATITIHGYAFRGAYDAAPAPAYANDDVVTNGGEFWVFDDTETTDYTADGAPQTSDWVQLESTVGVRMDLSGASGGSLLTGSKVLTLKPKGGSENDWVTFYNAIAVPSMSTTFSKDDLQVYEISFRALPGDTGWVAFGAISAVAG